MIKKNKLSRHKYNFNKKGYLHLKSFFNENEIKKNHLQILSNLKKLDKVRLINPHKKYNNIKKLYKNKKLVHIASNLLNSEIFGLQSEVFLNPPGSKGHPPHQDDFFINSGFNNSLNIWVPMVNTNKKNGTLEFFTNLKKKKIDVKKNEMYLNGGKKINTQSNLKKKIINCKIGDIIVISNYIFHHSYNNLSKSNRFVVAFGYIKQDSNFTVGKSAKRKITKLK